MRVVNQMKPEKSVKSPKSPKSQMGTSPLAFCLSLMLMVLMVSQSAFATPVSVNNKTRNLETISVSGRQYISGDALKGFGLTSTVSGTTMKLTDAKKEVTFEFKQNANTVKVNGSAMTFDGNALIKDKKAYYPLRLVFETMNYAVGYNAKSRQTTLTANTKSEFPVVIKDEDASYTFTKPVGKIVSLAPSITEILFAIGADDKLVGRTKYCTYPAAASKIKSVGTLYEPDVEGIINMSPDLVIAATHMNEDSMKMFNKAGIKIATQKSPERIAQIYTLIDNLGVITGNEYQARALVSSLKAKSDRIANVTSIIPTAKKATVYYVVGTGKKEYSAGADTFINDVFTKAGAKNVADDVNGWAYTLEKLIDHNPKYIFGEKWAKDTMAGSGNYASLSALKNGKFVVVEGNVFAVPGPRVIDEAMKLVIETLYPEYAKMLEF